MTTQLPAGPYRTMTTPEGESFSYYILPFDADGVCTGPLTRAHLLANLQGVTDIYLFSHGWNNDWSAATKRYEAFIRGYQALRSSLGLAMPTPYKPLLCGVFWPSQALALFDSEKGPGFASAAAQDADIGVMQSVLAEIAAQLPAAKRARFHALATAAALPPADATELAELLAGVLHDVTDSEAGAAAAPSAADLIASATALAPEEPDYDAIGAVGGGTAAGTPQAAGGIGGFLKALDPRNLIKPFTVWQMKDRAGKVGAVGVAPLLDDLLTTSDATTRVHLLGHSYGCKVVMTATCRMQQAARKIESALLLQPAISQYAFSESVPERNVPGGFHPALTRVRTPITATFSRHDTPLHGMFHLSVRRHNDLGELQYAGDESPSKFAALGGYGPRGTASATVAPIRTPGDAYTLPSAPALLGVDGAAHIDGHGGILNDAVWYLTWTLSTAHLRP